MRSVPRGNCGPKYRGKPRVLHWCTTIPEAIREHAPYTQLMGVHCTRIAGRKENAVMAEENAVMAEENVRERSWGLVVSVIGLYSTVAIAALPSLLVIGVARSAFESGREPVSDFSLAALVGVLAVLGIGGLFAIVLFAICWLVVIAMPLHDRAVEWAIGLTIPLMATLLLASAARSLAAG